MAKEFPLINDKIAKNLKKSSRDCYNNGVELLEEANILYDHERYARAVSLAILAEEELAKGLILINCSIHKRWDKEIYDVLTKHGCKQAMSLAVSKILESIGKHKSFANCSLFPMPYNFKHALPDIITEAKRECMKKQKRDIRKQDAQFVKIDTYGQIAKKPEFFTQKDAQADIDIAVRTKATLELIYGERKDDDPFFRSTHCLRSFLCCDLVLEHKSGVTLVMNAITLTNKNNQLTYDTIKLYTKNCDINIFEPNTLNDEQKKTLAKLYKSYDCPNQIKKEMQELGLRDTTYLEEVENLIADYAHE